MRPHTNDIEHGGLLTVIEIRDRLQNVAVSVKSSWPANSTRWVPVRVEDDFSVDEDPGGYSLIQGHSKSSDGRHALGESRKVRLVESRT